MTVCDKTVVCTQCGKPCGIIPLDNSFDYSGTHCTMGLGGTHYPAGYGTPVSDCCEAEYTEIKEL